MHAQFTYVHPFSDGNGRTGRLLQDWSLLSAGYYPGSISPSRRDDYYSALEAADGGAWDDIVELIAAAEQEVIGKSLAVLRENRERKHYINDLARRAAQKHANTRHKQYLIWRRRMEEIRDAFRQASEDLRQEGALLTLRVSAFDVVNFDEWERLCKGGHLDRSWFFALNFYVDSRLIYRVIAYFRPHVDQRHVDFFPRPNIPIGLYFTGGAEGRHDFSRFVDSEVRLRELLFDDSGVVRAYVASGDARWNIDESLSVASAVQSLVTDVFMTKGGLGD